MSLYAPGMTLGLDEPEEIEGGGDGSERAEAPEPRGGLDPSHPTFTLKAYLREIADVPTLGREEERELATRIREATDRFRLLVEAVPYASEAILGRWEALREAGRSTSSLSSRFRDPNAGDPGPELDRALSGVGRAVERLRALENGGGGADEREKVRRDIARRLGKADVALPLLEDVHRTLREHAATGRPLRGFGMRPCMTGARP